MRQAVEKDLFESYLVGSQKLKANLLQFIDNTLFVGKASVKNVIVLESILRCFELVYGLKVNFHKSKLGGMCISGDRLLGFASILNCRTMDIPFVYHGLMVGGNPRKASIRDGFLEECRSKLAKWKSKNLSFGDRIYLIKSDFSSLPI